MRCCSCFIPLFQIVDNMNPLVDEISKFSLRFVFGKRYNRTNILFLPAVFIVLFQTAFPSLNKGKS